jgi:hypothetical protein
MLDRANAFKAHALAPSAPWNNWKADDLGRVVMDFMEDQEAFWSRWAETWYQNFSFIYGNQNVVWSRRHGYAVDRDFLRREPSTATRAQTNLARVVVEALASLIYSNLPSWDVNAASESSVSGKRFKKIIQKLLDAYMQRLCMDKEFSTASLIYTTCGQVGAWVDWDHTGGQLRDVPRWHKVKKPVYTDFMAENPFTGGLLETPTPALDSMGEPLFEEQWERVIDELGRQIIDKMFSGDAFVDMLTPFEYRREIGSQGTHKTKYVQRIRLMDFDDYLDKYSTLKGKTKYFDQVKPVYSNPAIYKIAVRHFMRMQYTTPPNMQDSSQRNPQVMRHDTLKNKVLVVEHFDRPHPVKWPRGRRLIIVNGVCTHVTEPSYNTNKKDGWHPLVEAQWLAVAPSSVATGPMNDVIAKNRELNVADGLLASMLRRNCGSQLLIKQSAGVDPQRFTGEPGKVHQVLDPFAFRWLHDDMPISPVVAELRGSIKEDIYETSGAQDALRGERSEGASSGYAQRQIQEREERRLAPAKKSFGYFARGIGEKLFACVKQNTITLDDDMMGILTRSGAGEFKPQDVIAMLSQPIDYGVEINIEDESMALKSKATMQATLLELVQKTPAGVRLQNPKVLDQVLKLFDAEDLRDPSRVHRDRAESENEVFDDMLRLGFDREGIAKPIVFFEDDDDIHIEEHTTWYLENIDEIRQNPELLKEHILHLETHRLQKQEKEAQLPPGTALQTPNMMSAISQGAASGQPNSGPPSLRVVYGKAQEMNMQKAMQPQAQQGANGAQAPSQPAPPGSKGPPQRDPNAPSANTPSAVMQGGKSA